MKVKVIRLLLLLRLVADQKDVFLENPSFGEEIYFFLQ